MKVDIVNRANYEICLDCKDDTKMVYFRIDISGYQMTLCKKCLAGLNREMFHCMTNLV